VGKKLCFLLKRHKDVLTYIFFGALTTLVNFLVYAPMHYWMQLPATISNCVAWVVAVVFAYLTNKPFVFHSNDWSAKTVLPEFGKFVSCRVGSGVIETLILALTVDILGWDGLIMKVVTSVVVVILNYIASKFLVFRR